MRHTRVSEEPFGSNETSLPHWHQRKRPAVDPISQGILAGRSKEKSLFCCGPGPVEYSITQSENCSHSSRLPEAYQNLVLLVDLGPWGECALLEVVAMPPISLVLVFIWCCNYIFYNFHVYLFKLPRIVCKLPRIDLLVRGNTYI